MIRPDAETLRVVAAVAVQHPAFVEWLGEWRQRELEQLPHVTTQMATAQGRCQVLTELYKLCTQAPKLPAQPPRGS
jgi:hypothetical protein